MEISFLSILLIGFVLGVKHSLEPDHIIAVSTIASRGKKLWRSTLAGAFWGIGHTVTLFIVGIILILMKNRIADQWAMSLEFLVGIMLVYLGVNSILVYKKHNNRHTNCAENITFLKSLLIGVVHGLAGSAAMVLLTLTTVDEIWQAVLYILIFGLGTIIGMAGFTTVLVLPFIFSAGKRGINHLLTQLTGVISTCYGLYYMYNLGVTEGLFNLWLY